MKTKILNVLLLLSFIVTMLVPLTGIMVHKMASTVFLLLCLIHVIVNRRTMNKKRYLLIAAVLIAFLSGLFGMIFEQVPIILMMHRAISIICVCFLAIHVFVYHKRFCNKAVQ